MKQKLALAYTTFHDLKNKILPGQIKQAQETLIQGETTTAEKFFTRVLLYCREYVAEVAYQLGQFAESRIDCQVAEYYYRKTFRTLV